MDWAEDCVGLGEGDFQKVWKYDERYTTVVSLTSRDEVRIEAEMRSSLGGGLYLNKRTGSRSVLVEIREGVAGLV